MNPADLLARRTQEGVIIARFGALGDATLHLLQGSVDLVSATTEHERMLAAASACAMGKYRLKHPGDPSVSWTVQSPDQRPLRKIPHPRFTQERQGETGPLLVRSLICHPQGLIDDCPRSRADSMATMAMTPTSTAVACRGSRPGPGAPLIGGAVGLNVIILGDLPGWFLSGGAAFLLAWLVTLAGIALPLIWLEQGLGTCFQSNLPGCLHRSRRRWEWLGWWGTVLLMGLAIASLVFMADIGHLITSTTAAAHDSQDKPSAVIIGVIVLGAASLWLGAHQGRLDRAVLILMPLAVVTMVVIVVIGLMQPEGGIALAALTTMRWSLLLTPGLWLNAVALAVASALLGTGVVAHLSSLHPRHDDTASAGAMVLIGITMAQMLLMLTLAVLAADSAATSGLMPGSDVLARPDAGFVVSLPGGLLSHLLGLSLLGPLLITLALASQHPIAAVRHALGWPTITAHMVIGALIIIAAVLMIGYGSGPLLDGLLICGLLPASIMLILVSHHGLGLNGIRGHLDAHTALRPGRWWQISLETILPYVVLLACCQRILQMGRGHPVLTMMSVVGAVTILPLIVAYAVPWQARMRAEQ